jgi:hypothetical protein
MRGGADPVVYYLNSGEHTILIEQREDGTKLDEILITSNLDLIPVGVSGENTPADFAFEFEAENGSIGTPMRIAADNDASGGDYIYVPNGAGSQGYAQYTFSVPESGSYVVWGRVLATNDNDDSFFVSIDGGTPSLWDTQRSNYWLWDRVSMRGGADPVVYYLNSGEHTILIEQREDGTKLDKILITNNLNLIPKN